MCVCVCVCRGYGAAGHEGASEVLAAVADAPVPRRRRRLDGSPRLLGLIPVVLECDDDDPPGPSPWLSEGPRHLGLIPDTLMLECDDDGPPGSSR